MLKKRIIAAIFIRNDIVVQSIKFKKYLPVGKPEITAEAFCNWGADEILLIDLSATQKGKSINLDIVEKVASKCSVPLTVGGGVRNIETIGSLLQAGADKVCMNTSILDGGNCIKEGRSKFGRQSMVGSIDFVKASNDYFVFDYRTANTTNKLLTDAAVEYIDRGCGELLINDVERDGTQVGFDLELISQITDTVSVPVTWCGGAGRPADFISAFQNNNLSGVAAGNIFHFCEHSINIVKSQMSKIFEIRHDTQFNYSDMPITDFGRITKLPEGDLEELLYEKLEVEII